MTYGHCAIRVEALLPNIAKGTSVTRIAEQLLFLRNWVVHPRRVGAIAPSGEGLANVITQEITPFHAPVIELGAGTGIFTQRLIERGVPESGLVIVEQGAWFARCVFRRT